MTIGGIEYIHIQDFAEITGRSKQAIRRLIEDGNSVRRLKATRDRSRLMVPVMELVGFPFVNQGKQMNGTDIYHYVAEDTSDDQALPAIDAITKCSEMVRNGEDWKNKIVWERKLCVECTFGGGCGCICRGAADALNVPRGDP